jgi:small GTP-binding protein
VKFIEKSENSTIDFSENQQRLLEKLMDVFPPGFFTNSQHGDEPFDSINYIFEILNRNARGGSELIMLSLIPDEPVNGALFQSDLKQLAEKLSQSADLYKAFHLGSEREENNAQISKKLLLDSMQECLIQCMKNPAIQKSGKLVFYGLKAVGKTSILRRLSNNTYDPNIKPTLGMDVVRAVVNSFKFIVHDLSGQETQRKAWFDRPIHPNAIVYVMDCSASAENLKNARLEFERIIDYHFKQNKEHIHKNTPVLVLANKSDLVPKFSEKDLEQHLNPKRYPINFKIGVVSALQNIGIEENFKWLVSRVMEL